MNEAENLQSTDKTAVTYEPMLAADIFDKDYRIVKETGKLTGEIRYYPQYLSKQAWRKPKWKSYYKTIGESTEQTLIEFKSFEESLSWLKYKIEYVNNEYFYIGS